MKKYLTILLRYILILSKAVKRDDLHCAKELLNLNKECMLQSSEAHSNSDLVNDTTLWGWSALHVAAYFAFDKIFMLLLSEGGKPELKTKDGLNCL